VKALPLLPQAKGHTSRTPEAGLPLVAYRMFIAPYWHEGEVCMTVRQLQRHAIFMGKFTQLCKFFTRLRHVTLDISVAFFNFYGVFYDEENSNCVGHRCLGMWRTSR